MIEIFCPFGVIHVYSSIIPSVPFARLLRCNPLQAKAQAVKAATRAAYFAVAENLIHQVFIPPPLYRLEPVAPPPQPGVSHE
jgi:hypothetical protein